MAHRIIISSAVQTALQDQDVQAELSDNQNARVAIICAGEQPPCDVDMHYLLRMLGRAYAQED